MGKKVGVVCATYRNPEHDSLVREYGTISLVEQMLGQDFDGSIKVCIVDSSPTPHPFFDELGDNYSDHLLYIHLPSRDQLPEEFKQNFPKAARFVPDNATLQQAAQLDVAERIANRRPVLEGDLKLAQGDFGLSADEWNELVGKRNAGRTHIGEFRAASGAALAPEQQAHAAFWKERLREVRGMARFVPFEKDYPIQTNILSQVFGERPSIGMKKNVGVQVLAEKFGKLDAIIFSDDDDHHAPDYVRRNVEALENAEFARMTRYYTHLFGRKEEPNNWGVFHLDIVKDDNDYWVLSAEQEEKDMYCLGPDGVFTKQIGGKFSRPVTMAWPILSHEGALHSYSFEAWERSVEAFGGAVPVSFCEDIIYYRQMKDHFGKSFRDSLVEVPAGSEAFIRIADGRNASIIEWSETVDRNSMPAWTSHALRHLNAAVTAGPAARAEGVFRDLARQYAGTGTMDVGKALNAQDTVKPGFIMMGYEVVPTF
ncbi:MAG: hypothetical protein WC989_05680 [Micavibrio sp.]